MCRCQNAWSVSNVSSQNVSSGGTHVFGNVSSQCVVIVRVKRRPSLVACYIHERQNSTAGTWLDAWGSTWKEPQALHCQAPVQTCISHCLVKVMICLGWKNFWQRSNLWYNVEFDKDWNWRSPTCLVPGRQTDHLSRTERRKSQQWFVSTIHQHDLKRLSHQERTQSSWTQWALFLCALDFLSTLSGASAM